ncbi:MAG: hypothetical protein QXN05_02720 [Acidilobaceae archaeon]
MATPGENTLKPSCKDVLEALERGLSRLVEDLVRAVDTTPSTVSSKQLVIGALGLAMGLRDAIVLAFDLCSCDNQTD